MSNNLLYALSARGSVLLGAFDEIFTEVFKGLPVDEESGILNRRREVIRALDCLGHCEINYDDRKISVCPPTLALLPTTGLLSCVLTGARSPRLMKKLKELVRQKGDLASIRILSQRYMKMDMPSAVFVDGSNFETLKSIADTLGLRLQHELPSAWNLTDFSAGIDGIAAGLNFEDRSELNWSWKAFNPRTLYFDRASFVSDNGTRLVCYTNPVTQQRLHRLWRGGKTTEVERDWGRYLFLNELSYRVILYDERHFRLGVPSTIPLPSLIARALTLCSGLLPKTIKAEDGFGNVSKGHPLTIYSGVIPQMAELVGRKLNQNILFGLINSNIDGGH